MAGLSQMPRGRFYAYNVVGGVVWCSSMMLAGYWLGSIPWVRANLHWVSVIIIGLSLIPVALQWWLQPGDACAGLARPGAAASGRASPA